jgi:hypothetical protein
MRKLYYREERIQTEAVLTITFGPKRYETIKGWRKLQNEKLHELHSSPMSE